MVNSTPPRIWASPFVWVAFALLFALTVFLQVRLGAFTAEFDYDEASHYVTGLFVHDYLFHAFGRSPVAYLKEFHSHYPLVGIGHWGPAQYGVEAIWMALFGTSRVAVLMLSAVITSVTAAMILVVALRARLGLAPGLFAAIAFVLSPIIQQGSDSLMLDVPITLTALLAALCYQAYLDRGTITAAIGFALLASAGLLIKGTAGCLALLPAFAVLIGGRWDLLRRPSFWLPLPIVGVLAVPWYAETYQLVSPGFRYQWGWDYTSVALPANLQILFESFGPLALPLGLIGLVLTLMPQRLGKKPPVALAALLAAVFIFQIIAPAAIQDRYLAPALPPLFLLGAFALSAASNWLAGSRDGRAAAYAAVVIAVLVLSALPSALATPAKRRFGTIETAQAFWAHVPSANPVILIGTDGAEESAAVAEIALGDPARPSAFAVRGSRLLGGGGYNTADYQPRFSSAAEVMAALDDYAIPFVMLRGHALAGGWAHVDQLEAALAANPDRWELISQNTTGGLPTRLYRLTGNAEKTADLARIAALSAPKALAP